MPPGRAFLARLLLALALAFAPAAAWAKIEVSFHSFNGSLLGNRFPHAFVVVKGTLEDTGDAVDDNWGFTAKSISPAILTGPVEAEIYHEKAKYVTSTNSHFTLTVSDATYRRMLAEMNAWANAPGKFYDLDHRNCIHFVGRIAELGGLKVDYPHELLRKPKAWLNHVAALNPQLHARTIR
jgi:hypothetical protein